MRFAIVIPARYASTRYPGKPLAMLRGAGGEAKSLIQRSWECAKSVEGSVGVWVATDDARIAEEVARFGGQVLMTSPDCANGTERCAEASAQLDPSIDIVVNLQGDAPLTPPEAIAGMLDGLERADVATVAVRTSGRTFRLLREDERQGRVGGTTVVLDAEARALYFSKRILPYLPNSMDERRPPPVLLHLGLYAYRRSALETYRRHTPCELEQLEGLEQLRFLHAGVPVAVHVMTPPSWPCVELNNSSDVPVIEGILAERGIE